MVSHAELCIHFPPCGLPALQDLRLYGTKLTSNLDYRGDATVALAASLTSLCLATQQSNTAVVLAQQMRSAGKRLQVPPRADVMQAWGPPPGRLTSNANGPGCSAFAALHPARPQLLVAHCRHLRSPTHRMREPPAPPHTQCLPDAKSQILPVHVACLTLCSCGAGRAAQAGKADGAEGCEPGSLLPPDQPGQHAALGTADPAEWRSELLGPAPTVVECWTVLTTAPGLCAWVTAQHRNLNQVFAAHAGAVLP